MEPGEAPEEKASFNEEYNRWVSETARKMRHADGITDEAHKKMLEESGERFDKEWREQWIAIWGQPPEAGPVAPELGMSMSEWQEWKKTQSQSQADSQKQKS